MGYQQKVRHHLAEAEKWHRIVLEHEAMADNLARELVDTDPRYADQDPAYVTGTLLRDHFRYNRAVRIRNGHQAMIQMYGMAHLVEESSE